MPEPRKNLRDAAELCRQAHERLDGQASFRLQTLLDMLLLEMGRELALFEKQRIQETERQT